MSRALAFGVLALLVAALFAPILARGQVLFPRDNRAELGLQPPDPDATASRFDDEANYFVPELQHHLQGDHSGWLSVWNPHVQLGRPSSHLSGLSPAFVLTRAISWFTHDPFVVYSWLASLTLLLTCLFAYLFLEALGLAPWASVCGAAGLGLGVFALYWVSFVMFLGGLCWTCAGLWLTARFVQRPSFARGLGIAFAVHALLLAAYPQQIVWSAYLLAGFGLATWWRSPARRPRRLVGLGISAVFGVLAALPVYGDLWVQFARSARIDTDPEFFLASLPPSGSLRDVGVFLGGLFDMFWQGNPLAPGPTRGFAGLCLTPLFASLVLVSWMDGLWRRTWPWLAFSAATLLITLVPSAYLFAVEHLGLSLSRFVPLAAALVPLTVAGAVALDHLLARGFAHPWRAVACAALAPTVALLGARGAALDGARVALGLLLFAGFARLVFARRGLLALGLVVVSVFAYGSELLLARPRDSIATTSPLVERLRELTPAGERYALLGNEAGTLLPPNMEALLGLTSLHSYDSLSSRAYQRWVLGFSEQGARIRGRSFKRIVGESKLDDEGFELSDVSVVASGRPLQSPELRYLGTAGTLFLFAPKRAPRFASRFLEDAGERPAGENLRLEGLARRASAPVSVVARRDDALELEFEPSARASFVLLSLQHHPHWTVAADAEVQRLRLNGFYLGAWLGPGATRVRFSFRPYARWMWIVHAGFALAALVALGAALLPLNASARAPGRP